MQKGERAVLTVGPEYGYKASGAGPIPPHATLTFEMELVGWDKPRLIEIYQWVGMLFMVGIIVYVLFVDDAEDIARKSQEL